MRVTVWEICRPATGTGTGTFISTTEGGEVVGVVSLYGEGVVCRLAGEAVLESSEVVTSAAAASGGVQRVSSLLCTAAALTTPSSSSSSSLSSTFSTGRGATIVALCGLSSGELATVLFFPCSPSTQVQQERQQSAIGSGGLRLALSSSTRVLI
jgi:hypothetical protein